MRVTRSRSTADGVDVVVVSSERSVGERTVIAQASVGQLAPKHAENIIRDIGFHNRIEYSIKVFQLRRRFTVNMTDIKMAADRGLYMTGSDFAAAHANRHADGALHADFFLKQRRVDAVLHRN